MKENECAFSLRHFRLEKVHFFHYSIQNWEEIESFKNEKKNPGKVLEFCSHSGYSKTCLKQSLNNRQNKGLKAMWYLNAGHKYCRMLHGSILQYF